MIRSIRSSRLLVVPLLVWVAAVATFEGTLAVQWHGDKNVQGYICNGRNRICSTYAFYRTFQVETSLAIVAGYFNVSVDDVSRLNNLTATDSLSKGQALYIPITCACSSSVNTSQMLVQYTMPTRDAYTTIVSTIYGYLTTFVAELLWNPTLINNDNVGAGYTITVPIFCACPTELQIDTGFTLLLTYVVAPGDTLDAISSYFGVTTDLLNTAQRVEALTENATLLVPLSGKLPRIPTGMKSGPHGIGESSSSTSRGKVGIVSGLVAGAVAVLLVFGFFIARHRITSSKRQRQDLRDFAITDPNWVPRTFTFKELSKATKNFSKSRLLGTGGFGAVYKGTLPSGVLVAVKQMKMERKHGIESFQAEVASLSHIRHRNLVELRGWCHDDMQLYLVYAYMSKGNLDMLLFRTSERIVLELIPLVVRRSILSGVAAALLYLHEECAQCVLHRDIKSSNVLLDGDLNAYLGDFGLARLVDHKKMGVTTMIAGTFGYMAPEMHVTCKATKETDVFSFGVLMLEVMCGARPLNPDAIDEGENGMLVDKVWQAHEGGDIMEAADSRLGASVAAMEYKKMITNLLHLGLLCCNPNSEDRPSTRLVSQLLQHEDVEDMEADMPPLPRCKPKAQYATPGFSQILSGIVLSPNASGVAPASLPAPADASGVAAPLSAPPNSKPVTSFVASSAFYSGR